VTPLDLLTWGLLALLVLVVAIGVSEIIIRRKENDK
jgi:hypothetical protein